MNAPRITAFLTHRMYLGLTPSPYQLTLIKGFYGLPLTDEERQVWQQCTHRDYPATPFAELTLISGARSGKNSYVLTPILLYEALSCWPSAWRCSPPSSRRASPSWRATRKTGPSL